MYIAQTEIFSTSEYRNRFDRGTVKRNMHVRFKNLPTTGGYVKRQISDLRAPELGQLVQLTGTIVKTGPVKLLEGGSTISRFSKSHCTNTNVSLRADWLMQCPDNTNARERGVHRASECTRTPNLTISYLSPAYVHLCRVVDMVEIASIVAMRVNQIKNVYRWSLLR